MSDRIRTAVAGALAAGTALAVSELVAGLFLSVPSLIEAVGGVFIDNVPSWLKDLAIQLFGTNDKVALIVGIAIVTLLIGAIVGVLARHRRWLAAAVFVAFGVVGAAAAIALGEGVFPSVVGGLVAAAGGYLTLSLLYGRLDRDEAVPADGDTHDTARRAFLTGAGAVLGVAAIAAGAGRVLIARATQAIAGRSDVVLPMPDEVVAAPSPSASLAVDGLSPLITPNDDFYKIDTTLSTPQVDLSNWSLRIHGMVDRELEFTYDDLLEMDHVERYVTLSCVSNEVGGGLVGNAKWLGVPLGELLDRAGVQDGAGQVVGRSVDDFTVGFPTEAVYDGRDALVAVGMNDEPLPFDHGFPARLVVAGLYGYVSATKWLSDIELTTWEGFDAYWVPRGWSKEGPIKTQSRIDTPRPGSTIGTEERAVAGVAWAPDRGIARVEVQIDEGPWTDVELSEPLDEDSWVQWMLPWTPEPGSHRIRVRATDGTGETQTQERSRPAPDGATGWHTIDVTVRA